MTSEEEARFHQLQQSWCPAKLIEEIYGLDLRSGKLRDYFERQSSLLKRPEILRDTQVHRYHFETTLQANQLVPRKWAAAKLGMTEASFRTMYSYLETNGLLSTFHIIPELINKYFDDEITQLFNELRFTTFANHTAFCTKIHEALSSRFGLKIEPLYCVTSEVLKEQPCDFAQVFDCITLNPVGMKYKVWLDFKKPMNLRPDYCSTLFYAQERVALEPFLAGTEKPPIPAALLSYLGR